MNTVVSLVGLYVRQNKAVTETHGIYVAHSNPFTSRPFSSMNKKWKGVLQHGVRSFRI
jgi:protoporphyrinogen oxidase